MKYLIKFNESKLIEDTINDICLELSDLGFYSDINGRKLDSVIIQPGHGSFYDKTSYVGIGKDSPGQNFAPFHFDEIKDCFYRLKDVVGIEKISTFNYHLVNAKEYTRCDMSKLENETLNIGVINGAFIVFNFPIVSNKI